MNALIAAMAATAQASTEAARAAATATERMGARTESDAFRHLQKPEKYGSHEKEKDLSTWREWTFSFKAWLACQDMEYETELEHVEDNAAHALDPSTFSAECLARSRKLYQILGTTIKGRLLRIVMQVGGNNGYEAYRQILQEMEPVDRSRGLALLSTILAAKPFEKGAKTMDSLRNWERQIDEYERAAGIPLQDDLKVAVALRCLPEATRIQIQIRVNASTRYAEIREMISDLDRIQNPWTQEQVTPKPMEVDAVFGQKGKGKGKGKGKKSLSTASSSSSWTALGGSEASSTAICHNCGKKGHYAKDCWSKKKEGGGTSSVEGKGSTCIYCGKMGHTANECWHLHAKAKAGGKGKKKGDEKGKGRIHKVENSGSDVSIGPSDSASQVPKQVQAIQEFVFQVEREEIEDTNRKDKILEDIDGDTSSIFSVMQEHENIGDSEKILILVDSGSDEHVCPRSFAPRAMWTEEPVGAMRDAQGKEIHTDGVKKVKMHTVMEKAGKRQFAEVSASFVVATVKGPLLSLGKLMKKGYVVRGTAEYPYLLYEKTKERIPMKIIRNSLYLEAYVQKIQVSPVEGEGEVEPMQVEEEGAEHERPEESVRVGPAEGEGIAILTPNSPVAKLKERLRALKSPVWGTKAQLWQRLYEKEMLLAEERRIKEELDRRHLYPDLVPTPLTVKDIPTPTDEERRMHEVTHLPFAPWCEHCQRGKARDHPHRGLQYRPTERGIPIIAMDIADNPSAEAEDPSVRAGEYAQTLIAVDNDTGFVIAVTLPEAGPKRNAYVDETLDKFIKLMGHDRVCIRTDNAPDMMNIAKRMVERRAITTSETTPLYSSASNGRAERFIQTTRRQMITMRYDLQEKYKIKIDANSSIWPWINRHAAWLLSRYHLKANRKTAFEEVYDQRYNGGNSIFRRDSPIPRTTSRAWSNDSRKTLLQGRLAVGKRYMAWKK